jgi:hypothetical protein
MTWRYIGKSDPARLAVLSSSVPFGDVTERVKRENMKILPPARTVDSMRVGQNGRQRSCRLIFSLGEGFTR